MNRNQRTEILKVLTRNKNSDYSFKETEIGTSGKYGI